MNILPTAFCNSNGLRSLLIASSLIGVASAADFDAGSDGSYGPLDLSTGSKTITLPPDGIIHCTTINIPSGRNLTFTKNANNTPVYLLATGDVTISGGIDVNGQGYIGKRGGAAGPGGFDGGQGGENPGDGFGPGGGKGGWVTTGGLPSGATVRGGGGYGTAGIRAVTGGATYGNSLLIPLSGGSGGGGGNYTDVSSQLGGGGGGGALLIASNTKISCTWTGTGYISATGGSAGSGFGGGSGGAIRLVAPVISGTVGINVNGTHEGGWGRVRVDALSNSLNIVTTSAQYATFGANMVVFPPNLPEIRVTQAAGETIPLTRTDPVFVLLPPGSPATQTVSVQVKNFNGVVPLSAIVTPEAGQRSTYDFEIDNTSGAPVTGTVNVQIPAGVSTRVDVWTR